MSGGRRPRIVVGLSGGVDSSVAAALLVEQGYEVVGVTLHLAGSGSRCCSLEDADDARRVAERLGIRFYVVNQQEAFRREVIEPFADAYLAGETPLPCVACNRGFKFGTLRARARALGAEGVATGHYARIAVDPATGERHLLRARDRAKDQSYFLFDLSQEQLAARASRSASSRRTRCARARARSASPTADKPESQEICFVPDGDYASVVEALRPDAAPRRGRDRRRRGPRARAATAASTASPWASAAGSASRAPSASTCARLDAARNRVVVGTEAELAVRRRAARAACAGSARRRPGRSRPPCGSGTAIPARRRASSRRRRRRATSASTRRWRRWRPARPRSSTHGERVLGGGWIAAPHA